MTLFVRDGNPQDLPWGWERYRGDLLDVNVWVALVAKRHMHHATAKAYWEQTLERFALENLQQEDRVAQRLHFCRTSMLGMVRVLSQRAAMQDDVLTLQHAWKTYLTYAKLDETGWVEEPMERVHANIEAIFAGRPNLHTKHWTDAYLAALAKSLKLRMVSFDVGMRTFGIDDCLILGSDAAQA